MNTFTDLVDPGKDFHADLRECYRHGLLTGSPSPLYISRFLSLAMQAIVESVLPVSHHVDAISPVWPHHGGHRGVVEK